MPRGKRSDKIKKKDVVTEEIRRDHEEFLKTFEKPTQIYRFIRARQLISPTFLHRTALYMPERCSRNNSRRKEFKVDDIFTSMLNQGLVTFNNVNENTPEELWIALLGFYDVPIGEKNAKKRASQYKRFDVEIAIKKSIYAKRKSSEIQHTTTKCSTVNVPVNPKTNFENSSSAYFNRKDGVIKIPYSNFIHNDDRFSSAFSILLTIKDDRTENDSDSEEESEYESESGDEDDPDKKRRKVEEEDDPAGISLKNLTSGPRKRKTRTQPLDDDDDGDENPRRGKRSIRKEEESACNDDIAITHKIKEKMAYIRSNSNTSAQQTVLYETELACFDCDKNCQLLDGEYDIVMKELNKSSNNDDDVDFKRQAHWETFEGGKEISIYSSFSEPTLKFHLMWKNGKRETPKQPDEEIDVEEINFENTMPLKSPVMELKVDSIEYRKCKLSKFKNTLNGESNGINGTSSDDSVIQYQFMYNNNTQMQTESRLDLFCPWCQLNCFTRYGLMKHLTLCHPRFLFSYSQQPKGAKIIVNINQCYDGSFVGNPQNMFNQPGLAFGHRRPARRIPSSDIIVYRPQRIKPTGDLSEILEKENSESISMTQYRAGHRRLYFHSLTLLPIKPSQFDYDSEVEGDADWLTTHMKQMIDEFTDVNEGEKALMKMWNIHIMQNPCICDSEMEEMCKNFIIANLETILKNNLSRNVLLHVICLVDFGVLKSSSVRNVMEFFRKAETDYNLKHSKIPQVTTRIPGGIQKKVHPGVSPDFPEPDMLVKMNKLKSIISVHDQAKKE